MHSYGPLCTQFYDLDKTQAPLDAFEYYLSRAKESSGPVLEPMCGSGRFLLPLLRAGVEIEGFDASPSMLAACHRHASHQRLHPVLYHQFIERLELPRRFRMAFIPSGSIGLLQTDQSLRLALCRLRQHLEPGAVLLLEVIPLGGEDESDNVAERDLEPRSVRIGSEHTLVYRCRVAPSTDRRSVHVFGRYEEMRGDKVVAHETEFMTLRKYGAPQFLMLLDATGYVRSRLLDTDQLGWLRESGCLLIEAQTDA